MPNKPKRVTAKKTTLAAAAKTLGVTSQALCKSMRRHGVKAGRDGMFDAEKLYEAARAGAIQDKNALAAAKTPSDELQKQKLVAQIRLIDHQADRAQVEVEKLRGELITTEDHRAQLLLVVNACRRTIDNWIKSTAASVGDPEVKRKLESARRQAYAATEAEYEYG